MKELKLDQIQIGSLGIDAYFEHEPKMITPFGKTATVTPRPRVKVGSLAQLNGFLRVSAETLIHKSTKDLWSIKREGNEYYIERLFQEGSPVKG